MTGVQTCALPISTLALAQDNAFGQPLESQLRSCLLASWICDAAGVEVGAISVSRPSLDDVFLEATGRRLEGAQQEHEHVDEAAEEDEAAARAVAP